MANPREVQDANLIAGFKGSAIQLGVKSTGLQREAFALAFKIKEFSTSLDAFHLRKLRQLTQLARDNFDSRTHKRPAESGYRPGRRETGKFTFGARGGGAFKGVLIKDEKNGVSGFGYPNVPHADAKTNYVWRTLEFGLRPHPEAVRQGTVIHRGSTPISAEAPIGEHKLPKRFGFTGPNPATSRLVPLASQAVPNARAKYVRLFGKGRGRAKRSRVTAKGIAPMFFISDAIGVVAETLPAGYRQVVARTYGRR